MPEDKVILTAEVASLLKNFQRAIDQYGRLTAAADQADKQFVRLDGTGKVIQATFKKIISNGSELVLVFKKQKDKVNLVSQALNENSIAFEKSATAAQVAAQKTIAAVQAEQQALGAIRAQARDAEIKKFDDISATQQRIRRQNLLNERQAATEIGDVRKRFRDQELAGQNQLIRLRNKATREELIANRKLAIEIKKKIAAEEKAAAAAQAAARKAIAAANQQAQALAAIRAQARDAEIRKFDDIAATQGRIRRQDLLNEHRGAKAVGDARKAIRDQELAGQNQLIRLRNKAAREAVAASNRTTDGTKKAVKATDGLLLSWKSVVRLLSTQIVYRAVFGLVRQLQEATSTALKFTTTLAEVRTIDTSRSSVEEWTKVLRELSDAFGIPILEATEAAYQALSNQIVNSAAEFKQFGEIAARFSLATVTSLDDSVKLLSGTLNAFKLELSDAERVASTFFKTIELGRLRGNELTDIGNLAVLAGQLGFELEELQALLATVTIQGVKLSEASTQLRGIFIKLLKPTKATKEIFAELGVTTGEALVNLFGGAKALELWLGAAKDSSAIAALQPRIRGLSGALILVSDDFKTFNRSLAELTEDALPDFARASALVLESTGKTLSRALNDLKNFFITDLLTDALGDISALTFEFRALTAAVKVTALIVKQLLLPALALATFALTNFIRAHAAALLAFAQSPFLQIAIALGVIINVLKTAVTAVENHTKAVQASVDTQLEKYVELQLAQKAVIDQAIRLFEDYTKVIGRPAAQASAVIQGAARKIVNAQIELFEDLLKISTKTNKEITESIEDMVKQSTTALNKVTQELEAQLEAIRQLDGAFGSIEQRKFEISIEGLDVNAQLSELAQRIAQLQVLQSQASSAKDIAGFDDVTTLINQLLEQRKALVDATIAEKQAIIEKNKEIVKSITLEKAEQRIKLEKEARRLRQQFADDVSKLGRRKTPQGRADDELRLRQLQDKLNRDINALLGKDAELTAKIAAAAQAIIDAQTALAALPTGANAGVIKGLEDESALRKALAAQLEADRQAAHDAQIAFIEKEENLRIAIRKAAEIDFAKQVLEGNEAAVNDLANRQVQALKDLQKARDEARGTSAPGLDADLFDRIAAINIAADERITELQQKAAADKLKASEEQLKAELEAQKNIQAQRLLYLEKLKVLLIGVIEPLDKASKRVPGQEAEQLTNASGIARLFKEILDIRHPGDDSEAVKAIKKLEDVLRSIETADRSELPEIIGELRHFIAILGPNLDKAVTNDISGALGVPGAEQGIKLVDDLVTLVIALKAQQEGESATFAEAKELAKIANITIQDAADAAKAEIATAIKSGEVQTKSTDIFQDSSFRIRDAVIEFQKAVGGLADVVRASGGKVGAATGGLFTGGNPGVDTNSINVSRGEYIVNAASTRKFLPQLQAINSGKQQNLATGGLVDVGGINVDVHESSTPTLTARQVVSEIDRGLRNGTIRFRNLK